MNAPSTISRKVGFREEPGLRMLSKKDSISKGGSDGAGGDGCNLLVNVV